MYETKRKRFYIWIIIFILLLSLFNLPQLRESPGALFLRQASFVILHPPLVLLSITWNKIAYIPKLLFSIRRLLKENETLKAEIEKLKLKEKMLNDLTFENEKLRGFIGFKALSSYRLLGAEIIGRSPSNWFETIIINRGKKDGIIPDLPVIAADGIVGRIVETSAFSSKVLLITDPNSAVSGINQTSRDLGVVAGGAMKDLSMKYVSANANIKEGDAIVTSGMGEVFPKGIPIGRVSKVSMRDFDIFREVEIKPAVNFSSLERVFIIIK